MGVNGVTEFADERTGKGETGAHAARNPFFEAGGVDVGASTTTGARGD